MARGVGSITLTAQPDGGDELIVSCNECGALGTAPAYAEDADGNRRDAATDLFRAHTCTREDTP